MAIQKSKNMKGGQAIITAVVFFLFISLTIILGISSPIYTEVRLVRDLTDSKASYFLAESGQEDVIYRLKKGMQVSSSETLVLNGNTVTTLNIDVVGGKEIISSATISSLVRKVKTNLIEGTGASFSYGVQTGEGGFIMENFSSISGNLFSNGPVMGSGSSIIRGDVISAGPNGLADGIHATSSIWAHEIRNSEIDRDAHYQIIDLATTVAGTSFPGSADQATSSLPISDALIAEWETDALAGGIISSPCPYNITTNVNLGPVKIDCDLKISGTPTITLFGSVWVAGNIEVSNMVTIQIDPSLGGSSVAVIADNPINRETSSEIKLANKATFIGSGVGNSNVLLISQNSSAENGNFEKAIEMNNTVNGDLLVYAGHGEILLKNNITLKEVTAYRVRLTNSAEVIYELGLANLLFMSGPGGGYEIDSWEEVP